MSTHPPSQATSKVVIEPGTLISRSGYDLFVQDNGPDEIVYDLAVHEGCSEEEEAEGWDQIPGDATMVDEMIDRRGSRIYVYAYRR